ncbi:hypothetical protein SK128_009251 [Halocaridina rubra]|uniref:Uncharacterized protein n=1 Tax=Halocaridina rubra TaxID=373956 RepID=A0AAN8W9J2_HALRR
MASEKFTCCMGGWKEMRGLKLCPNPCCPGYEERVLKMPLLKNPVVCHKLTKEELQKKVLEKLTTTPLPLKEKDMMDEPRRIIRASSEYEDFLYRHRLFFLRLLNEGYSRKELLANLEKFLVRLCHVPPVCRSSQSTSPYNTL